TLDAHLTSEVPLLRKMRPEVPRELASVIDRMMAKDPANRFQTPIEVAAALEPFLIPEAPPVRRRRRLLVVACVAAMLLAFLPLAYFVAPTVIRIVTNKGVLVVEADGADYEVTI